MGRRAIQVIYGKIEATYNTDPTPVATDAHIIQNLKWTPNAPWTERGDRTQLVRRMRGGVVGKRSNTITFDQEIRGYGGGAMGANSKFPAFHYFLEACGYTGSWGANTWTYTAPNAWARGSLLSVYLKAWLHDLKYVSGGCRGNAVFNFDLGKPCMASYTFSGMWSADPTSEATPTPDYDTGTTGFIDKTPAICTGAVLNWKPYADAPTALQFGQISKLSLDLGNRVVEVGSSNLGSYGIGLFDICGGYPVVTYEVEIPETEQQNWTRYLAQTEYNTAGDISITVGSAAGDVTKFQLGGLVITKVEDIPDDNFWRQRITCQVNGTAASTTEDAVIITCV